MSVLALPVLFVVVAKVDSHPTTVAPAPSVDQQATVDALNKWWAEANYAAPVVKAGTVIEAHTITLKNGKVINIKAHVQTRQEEADELDDMKFVVNRLGEVLSFSVEGKTVVVHTTLGRENLADAQELCHDLGGFVWARENRHFWTENIKIVSPLGNTLSSRNGLSGKVH